MLVVATISSCWEEKNLRIFLKKSSCEKDIFRKVMYRFQKWTILYKSFELPAASSLVRNLLEKKFSMLTYVINDLQALSCLFYIALLASSSASGDVSRGSLLLVRIFYNLDGSFSIGLYYSILA